MKPGTHYDVAPGDYHRSGFDADHPEGRAIACSMLKASASAGPVSFRYGPKQSGSAAMAWGSLVDCLLFTPDELYDQFISKDDCPHLSADGGFRSKAAKEWKAEQEASGKTMLDPDLLDQAQLAVERIRNTPIAAEVLEGGRYQVALISDVQDVPIKALLDIVPHHPDHDYALADLKTTAINLYDDDGIARQVGKMRWHWQAAFYLDLWNKLNPTDRRTRWELVIQSSAPPYEVRVVELEDEWLSAGRAAVQFYLPRLLRDLKTDSFLSPFRSRVTPLYAHAGILNSDERTFEALEDLTD